MSYAYGWIIFGKPGEIERGTWPTLLAADGRSTFTRSLLLSEFLSMFDIALLAD